MLIVKIKHFRPIFLERKSRSIVADGQLPVASEYGQSLAHEALGVTTDLIDQASVFQNGDIVPYSHIINSADRHE